MYTFSIYSIASKAHESIYKNMFFFTQIRLGKYIVLFFYIKPSFWGIYGYLIGRVI